MRSEHLANILDLVVEGRGSQTKSIPYVAKDLGVVEVSDPLFKGEILVPW